MAFKSIMAMLTSFIPGSRLVDGGDCLTLAQMVCQATGPYVAHAGGGQANATPLAYGLNLVSTVTTAGDSVMLPQAIPGAKCVVQNDSANACQIFGELVNNLTGAGDQIAAYNSNAYQATGVGVSQAGQTISEYYCVVAGKWKQAQT